MRVAAYHSNPGIAGVSRRLTELLAAPTPSLSDRYPDRPRRHAPDTVRVVEGELLRRAPAADTLLADYRAVAIAARARRVDPAAPPTGAANPRPPTIQFYELYSSTDNLAPPPVGRTINQYV